MSFGPRLPRRPEAELMDSIALIRHGLVGKILKFVDALITLTSLTQNHTMASDSKTIIERLQQWGACDVSGMQIYHVWTTLTSSP